MASSSGQNLPSASTVNAWDPQQNAKHWYRKLLRACKEEMPDQMDSARSSFPLVENFCQDPALETRAVFDEFVIGPQHFKEAVDKLKFLVSVETTEPPSLSEFLNSRFPNWAKTFLFELFRTICHEQYGEAALAFRTRVLEILDLTQPHRWYPGARAMRRKIIYHSGPTNSGKTHSALNNFLNAERGIYCAPFRFLALEIFHSTSQEKGVPCELLTGQEKTMIEGAKHLSCTIEMADITKPWNVAVIDKIQLIGTDTLRSGSWTRALLGLQAQEIHVCGDPTAEKLVRKICQETGDLFNLIEHRRLSGRDGQEITPKPASSLLGSWKNIKPGDCLVVFSKGFASCACDKIRTETGLQCCVILGSQAPKKRAQQAKIFNLNASHSVLVATDAIAMGLELSIKRIVFYTLRKFDGKDEIDLPHALVKQIAGRAGRAGASDYGSFTTFYEEDYSKLLEFYRQPLKSSEKIGLKLEFERVKELATVFPSWNLFHLLVFFSGKGRLDEHYFLCSNADILINFKTLDQKLAADQKLRLPLEDMWKFSSTPTYSLAERFHLAYFIGSTLDDKRGFYDLVTVPRVVPDPGLHDEDDSYWHLTDMYLWLCDQFPGQFPDKELAEKEKKELEDAIEKETPH